MTKFTDAIEAFNSAAGLEQDQPPSVHLWQLLVSALEYADLHELKFDGTVAEAQRFHRDGY